MNAQTPRRRYPILRLLFTRRWNAFDLFGASGSAVLAYSNHSLAAWTFLVGGLLISFWGERRLRMKGYL